MQRKVDMQLILVALCLLGLSAACSARSTYEGGGRRKGVEEANPNPDPNGSSSSGDNGSSSSGGVTLPEVDAGNPVGVRDASAGG
jgi:hypothetical protein